MTKDFDLSLYLVLDPNLCGSPDGMVTTALEAVLGGATIVQLRHKQASTGEMIAIGQKIKDALIGSSAKLIINDDLEAAIAIGADGLHIGQSDMNAKLARERLGPDKIIGLSAETPELVARIDASCIDYAGLGPVYATSTKPDHKEPIGITGLRALAASCPVPSVAIGGLKAAHIDEVMETGVKGVAVVSAICGQPNPYAAARILIENIRAAQK